MVDPDLHKALSRPILLEKPAARTTPAMFTFCFVLSKRERISKFVRFSRGPIAEAVASIKKAQSPSEIANAIHVYRRTCLASTQRGSVEIHALVPDAGELQLTAAKVNGAKKDWQRAIRSVNAAEAANFRSTRLPKSQRLASISRSGSRISGPT